MIAIASHTVSEKVLLAAFALEETGQSPFSAEALIVCAWKKFPDTFGLKGYLHQFPDSNKVLSCIMGERGLPKRGWLTKLGGKQYAMTRDGRQAVRRLIHADEPAPEKSPAKTTTSMTRDQEKQLHYLLSSTALEKYLEDRKADLTFADACRYWGITENITSKELDERLSAFKLVLADLDRQLGASGNAVLPGGRNISGRDIGLLDELHSYLEHRFSRHLAVVRNRTPR